MGSAASEAPRTVLVRVRGLVQGVGYRWACVEQARALGLCGWVRNRSDGSVEAMLQGPPDAVARMCDWMRHEVPIARVAGLEMAEAAPPCPVFQGFEQRATV